MSVEVTTTNQEAVIQHVRTLANWANNIIVIEASDRLAQRLGLTALAAGWSAPALRRSLGAAAFAFFLSRAVVWGAILIAPLVIPQSVDPKHPELLVHTSTPWFTDAMVRWDGVHYLTIARDGYLDTPNVLGFTPRFWPLYPWLMRLLGGWAGEEGLVYAGLLLANLAFFVSLVLLYRMVEEDLGPEVGLRTVFYVAIFPGALFFSALYAEALLLFMSVVFLYLLRRQSWLLAGLFGGLAALTRGVGVLVIAPFLWECVRIYGFSLRRICRPLLASGLIPAGSALFLGSLWLQVGNPLVFGRWFQWWWIVWGSPAEYKEIAVSAFVTPEKGITLGGAWIGVLSSLLFLSAGAWLWRQRFHAYAVFALVTLLFYLSLALPTGTGTMIRYLAPIFPAFIAFGAWGANRWFHYTYSIVSLVFLVLATMLYAQWYWVG